MNRSQRIHAVLVENIHPLILEIINESNRHHVPEGSETHFKLIIVSADFEEQSRIQRHRIIHKLLAAELQQDLHALSLFLYTPEEWQNSGKTVPTSPACRDGYHE